MKTQRLMNNHSFHSQRGVTTILAVLMMLSLFTFLAVVTDTGRLYLEKRSLQKNADLAAMETALRYCRSEITADDILSFNIGDMLAPGEVLSPERNNFPGDSTNSTFTAIPGEGTVEVILTYNVPTSLFGQLLSDENVDLSARATAVACEPIAAFSVGTRLASLGAGESIVGSLLSGVGLDLGLDLMDYNGLVGATITPSGLLQALGIPVSADLSIADFNNLLIVRAVSLGEILDATATLVGQDSLLNLNLDLLSSLEREMDVTLPDIQLGSDEFSSGLFASITSPASSALDVKVDAMGLVSTAIGIATSSRAIDVDLALLPGGLGSLLGTDISAKVGIIEPPSIAIGGIGTTAYSSQTRVFAHIEVSTNDLLGGALGGLLGSLASVNVDIPLVIDLASASGTIEDMCTQPLKELDNPPKCPAGEDCATIAVDAQIAKICVGDIDPNTIFSTSASCDVGLTSKSLLSVELLGSSLIGLDTSLAIDPLETTGQDDLAEQQMMVLDGNIDLGTTVQDLTDALLAALLGQTLNSNPTMNSSDRTQIATEIWEDLNGDSCGSGYSGSTCRGQKLEEAQDLISDTSDGLQGFVADALLNPVVGLLDSVLTLNVGGILGSVGDLVVGLLGGVGDLLSGILVGNPCTGGGVVGSLFGNNGSSTGCIDELADALDTPSGQTQSNALVFLTGLLLEVLRPVLDAVGNNLLMPLLDNLLGLQLGQTEVNLLGLNCDGHSKLIK
ncbi:Uncharacterised protein [Zhongshania aliphaticivorans]|uniref:Putative Flp pilus-assembly TadG-like N-terminal domain-containing protein n=1 Tax=Zhongshania aliphaticivorans TaxID=1470434 RepID=A0A5S9NCM4_9GAMM|nr:pilus assembly protein TadG-related protein [Zhongshania aliphaticivorans]CAA0088008.1 Uncharacterised protein [Zhongshania aliphaticivorans]CAA0115781.1 Uncharacterised protein [Zhongshania aliphaticivorans]CAA0120306.1 Uncharacterised protein [Zhongshania aliphaticivorans]